MKHLPNNNWVNRWARRQVFKLLQQLARGNLQWQEADGELFQFGNIDNEQQLSAQVMVHSLRSYRRLLFGADIGFAESYMAGEIDCHDLTALVRVILQNKATLQQIESGFAMLLQWPERFRHWQQRNSIAGSKRNIESHYDLSNEFYSLWLDPSMMYSAAIYPDENASLTEAQQHKCRLIAEKLKLSSDDHLLEIGTGWGGFAIYAAKNYGCKVSTTTISEKQWQFATKQVQRTGLTDRVTVLKQDYRELSGSFDKLVSIEMIEAVGHSYLDRFMTVCTDRLKPDGLLLLQAILAPDADYKKMRNSVDFIKKYIFPGGFLPSVAAINESIEKKGQLQLVDQQEIGLDYARTLADWRQNFEARIEDIKRLGFDDQFIRMWRFYLCYCEGGFREQTILNQQLLFQKDMAAC